MERWSGRVAVVTGASAGIGAAISKELVRRGLKVVGVARRVEKVEAMKAELKNAPGQLYAVKADLMQEEDILNVFSWVKKNLGGIDVLVNNAGVASMGSLLEGETSAWQKILSTNVMSLSIASREAIKSMRERNVDDGHIININSVAGHRLPNMPGFTMYSASKHAVTVLTEGLKNELNELKSHIRVTSLSPGMVETEIIAASGALDHMPDIYEKNPSLKPQDIADAVVYVLGAPPRVQILELTITPTGEMF